MKSKFEIVLLEEVWEFFNNLDEKTKGKIIYNIDKSKYFNDPKLFKKIEEEIWEFRTKYNRVYYRLFAFWDKTDKIETLVVTTHGMIKRTDKIPKAEIEKAKAIRTLYFEQKNKSK